jgi:hypothetical protein
MNAGPLTMAIVGLRISEMSRCRSVNSWKSCRSAGPTARETIEYLFLVEPYQAGLRDHGLRRMEPVAGPADLNQLGALRLDHLPDRQIGQLGMLVRLGVGDTSGEQQAFSSAAGEIAEGIMESLQLK